MTDIPAWGTTGNAGSGQTFCITDGERVIASKVQSISDRDHELLAQLLGQGQRGTEGGDHRKQAKETDPNSEPAVSAHKIVSVCEQLGHDQTRWRSDNPHPSLGPKCNVYLDAAMKGSGLPRPWAETGVQSCEKLDAALAQDPRYEQAWHTNYSNEPLAIQNWQYFNQHPGDIFIWNRPDNGILHSAIADGTGKLYRAGSHSPTGFALTSSEYFTGTPEHPKNYGPPTSVYRYKNLHK